eukprot:scaffold7350_cov233-Pinguiococcus_pyrenoidosus.AAC.7
MLEPNPPVLFPNPVEPPKPLDGCVAPPPKLPVPPPRGVACPNAGALWPSPPAVDPKPEPVCPKPKPPPRADAWPKAGAADCPKPPPLPRLDACPKPGACCEKPGWEKPDAWPKPPCCGPLAPPYFCSNFWKSAASFPRMQSGGCDDLERRHSGQIRFGCPCQSLLCSRP